MPLSLKETRQEFGPLALPKDDLSGGLILDEETRQAMQLRRFRALARKAARETAYYRDLFASLDLDLRRLPFDEIAACVGIAKGTLYLHFSCKEALVVALFTREMERLIEDVEEAIASRSTACERLQALLTLMFSELRRKRAQFLASAYNGVDLHRIFSEQGSQIHLLWQRLARRVLAVFEEGVETGELKAVLPPRVMLLALFSLLSVHVSERLILEEEVSPEVFSGYIKTILFHGITA